ncbi:MAG: hypothetical protein KatS3mg061_2713 [Dehalococcoidia bacterium]|nr:MAG: hypothetical protein KatS3mg061_2713 [Dehalococcoidia bacterium]
MDALPPSPPLRPSARCFHCGGALPTGANFCPHCGAPPGLTAAQERGAVAYLLAAVEGWVGQRLLAPAHAERLVAPYQAWLGEAPSVPAPERRAPAPLAAPVNFAVIWANALLYVGAFFVVVATLFFLLVVETSLGRLFIMSMLAGLFFVSGLLARQVRAVRTAGVVFLAVGALLVPVVLLALVNWLREAVPLPASQLLLLASLACLVLYLAFTLTGFGRFYAFLSLVAFSAVVQAGVVVAAAPLEWSVPWWTAEAAMLAALHCVGPAWLRQRFGPLLFLWGGLWWLAALVASGALLFSGFSEAVEVDPAVLAWAAFGLTLAAAFPAFRQRDPLTPVLAGLLAHITVALAVRWAEGPEWSGALLVVLVAAGQIVLWWRAPRQLPAVEQFAVAIVVSLLALWPLWYQDVPGIGAAVGLVVTALLGAASVRARLPWLLVAPALALLVGWSFLLRSLPLAWSLEWGPSLLPLVLLVAAGALLLPRQQRSWGWMLGAVALGYELLALAGSFGNFGQHALLWWVAVLIVALAMGRWRERWLLAGLSAATLGAVAATLRLVAAPPEAFGPLAGVVAGGWGLAGHLLAGRAPRWSVVIRLVGVSSGLLAVLVASTIQLFGETFAAGAMAGHLASLTIALLALMVGAEARWRRLALYPASFLLLAAVLWELAAFGVDEPQAYAVPAGLFCGVVAWVSARDRQLGQAASPLAAFAWVAGALVLGLTTFFQSFGDHPLRYGVLLLAECFGLLALGAVVRSRALLATTVLLLVLVGVRLLFAEPALVPFVLFGVGLLLLAVGVMALVIVGWRQARPRRAAPTPSEEPAPPAGS